MVFSFLSRSRAAGNVEENKSPSPSEDGSTTPEYTKLVDPNAHPPTQAELIDAHFAKVEAEEADKELRNTNRKLKFNPSITPEDQGWKDFRATMISELAGVSLDTILKTHFEHEKGQNLFLIPPLLPGALLNLQQRNEKDYKALLAVGGRFHGQPDNLLTKLTMLKFGFPVASLTMKNLELRGDYPDKDDPPDGPEGIPRFQRIEFAEKPLDFLDTYNERSYGWKIIRRKKPSVPLSLECIESEPEPEPEDDLMEENDGFEDVDDGPLTSLSHPYKKNVEVGPDSGTSTRQQRRSQECSRFPKPVRPVGYINHPRRGGAGLANFPSNSKGEGFIYSHNGGRATVSSDVNSFVQKSLELLGIDPNTDWEFAVEQYDNSPGHKNKSFHPRIVIGAGSSNTISKSDTSAWEEVIEPRVTHLNDDWMMAVRILDGRRAPDNLHAAIWDGLGKQSASKPTSPPAKPSGTSTQPGGTAEKPVNPNTSSTKRSGSASAFQNLPTREVLSLADDSNSNNNYPKNFSKVERNVIEAYLFGELVPLSDKESFVDAVLSRVQDSKSDLYRFTIDRYSRKANRGEAKIEESFEVSNESLYENVDVEIFNKIHDTSRDWYFVAREAEEIPPSIFEPPYVNGRIWGYGGNLWAKGNADSILQKAQQLLGIVAGSDWSFFIDIHGEEISTHHVTNKNWSTFYETYIKDLLFSGKEDWPFFVRGGGPKSSTLQPITTLDIISLTIRGIGTVYWKVPRNILEQEYGINQPQESFFRAMQIFFPEGYARPASNLIIGRVCAENGGKDIIDGIDVGFGGMEVTPQLWARVKEDTWKVLSEEYGYASPGLAYYVETVDHAPNVENIIGIRLIGNHRFAHTAAGDFTGMMSEIIDLTENNVADKRPPSNFRIWKTAELREAHENGQVLKFGNTAADINTLERWFSSSQRSTNCVHYRPEWSTFKLIKSDGEEYESVPWDSEKSWTLASFRGALNILFKDLKPNFKEEAISIYDPQSHRRFILASDITEQEWRNHVYDWFSTSRLQVRVINDVKYILDERTPWGIGHGIRANVKGKENNWNKTKRSHFVASPGSRQIKFNRDRTSLSYTVGKKVPPAWADWLLGQNYLDKMQQATYLNPQSVIEPGRAPNAPLFAESKELAIASGLHTPTAYAAVLTPTDAEHLQTMVRKLRNQVLDRMHNCIICETNFEVYKRKEIIRHYQAHQEEIYSAGDCVLCGDKNWKFWNAKQKRKHLYYHQSRDEGTVIKNFWAGFQCPGCDVDLSRLGDKSQVLNHVIGHDPLTVKFCDRCSKPYRFCTAEELKHHSLTCTEGSDGAFEELASPSFCGYCGIDRSKLSTDEDLNHLCVAGPAKSCTTCGFDKTKLSLTQQVRHKADCVPPGGYPKTYCCRCGINIVNLDHDSRLGHTQTCKSEVYTEPVILKLARAKFQEINALITANAQRDAKRQKAIFELREGQKTLAKGQLALSNKEALLLSVINAIQSNNNTTHSNNNTNQILENLKKSLEDNGTAPSVTADQPNQPSSGTTFKCPLTFTRDDGDSRVCGHVLSLENGGASLIAHYIHKENTPLVPLGPNAAAFKRLRDKMETDTALYEGIVKKQKLVNYAESDATGSSFATTPKDKLMSLDHTKSKHRRISRNSMTAIPPRPTARSLYQTSETSRNVGRNLQTDTRSKPTTTSTPASTIPKTGLVGKQGNFIIIGDRPPDNDDADSEPITTNTTLPTATGGNKTWERLSVDEATDTIITSGGSAPAVAYGKIYDLDDVLLTIALAGFEEAIKSDVSLIGFLRGQTDLDKIVKRLHLLRANFEGNIPVLENIHKLEKSIQASIKESNDGKLDDALMMIARDGFQEVLKSNVSLIEFLEGQTDLDDISKRLQALKVTFNGDESALAHIQELDESITKSKEASKEPKHYRSVLVNFDDDDPTVDNSQRYKSIYDNLASRPRLLNQEEIPVRNKENTIQTVLTHLWIGDLSKARPVKLSEIKKAKTAADEVVKEKHVRKIARKKSGRVDLSNNGEGSPDVNDNGEIPISNDDLYADDSSRFEHNEGDERGWTTGVTLEERRVKTKAARANTSTPYDSDGPEDPEDVDLFAPPSNTLWKPEPPKYKKELKIIVSQDKPPTKLEGGTSEDSSAASPTNGRKRGMAPDAAETETPSKKPKISKRTKSSTAASIKKSKVTPLSPDPSPENRGRRDANGNLTVGTTTRVTRASSQAVAEGLSIRTRSERAKDGDGLAQAVADVKKRVTKRDSARRSWT